MGEPKLKEKRWDTAFEEELLKQWEEENPYLFNMDTERPTFVIDTPPPYPSGTWHIGAVAGYSFIDMIARFKRMKGYEVMFPFCLDKNGINIELTVERKFKKSLHDFDREEFIKICSEEIDKIAEGILTLARRIGMSTDFDEYFYETDSPEYRKVTQAIFIDLWKRGLIYTGLRPSFYCPDCRTAIAEAEVEYEERPSMLSSVKFKVKGTDEDIIITTTRPELLCACKVVLVHPSDERWQHLHGKTAIVPLYGTEVPITPHHYAMPELGTGIVMMCSYGDQGDVQIFRELALEAVKAIDEDGQMTEAAGPYQGMKVADARKKILEDLIANDLVTDQESMMHKTPICSRSRTEIEFIPMEEMYLKQLDILDKLREVAKGMKFYPPKHKRILDDWMDALTIDWPISRRRYYHTEIPLWYCEKCNETIVPPPGEYYQPWKDPPPVDSCPKCGGTDFVGEERVFDTWMDSSNSNLVATLYMRDDDFFEKNFPTHVRPQGREIVRTWLYYTTLKSWLIKEKKPFQDVFIHGLGLDAKGRAMHKSLGNVIEPEPVIERHGADSFRFWAASETNVGDDFRISEERIAGSKKFLTKLWNVARFVSSFEFVQEGELKPSDEWILSELNSLVEECQKGYDVYNFFVPSNKVRTFLWNVFAPHYLEMAKSRSYRGDSGALFALHEGLRTMLKILAPIVPFITEKIWSEIYGGSVHQETMPEPSEERKSGLSDVSEELLQFNSDIWKTKKDKGLSLKSELEGVEIPESLKQFESDLVLMHNLR
ncbi:MAG: valine--tRNA ligase [Methanomassiliicoccales archaeon]|nr:MAG: valine--tRNA ligase [Methanomassiliicoccales archaeon]